MNSRFNNPISTKVRETTGIHAEKAGAPRTRVLCIDNRASRNLALFLLRRAGYSVTIADSIFDAIDLSRDQNFDLFLVNHKLPRAADLYDELRAIAPNTPIVLYSTVIYPFHRRRTVSAIHGRKIEPVTVTEVAAAVARALEPRSSGFDEAPGLKTESRNPGFSLGVKLLFGAAGIGAGLLLVSALARGRRTSQTSQAS